MLRSHTHATLSTTAINKLRNNQTRPLTNLNTPINSQFSSISALNPPSSLKSKNLALFLRSLPNAPVLT